jgi:hypothetical protein
MALRSRKKSRRFPPLEQRLTQLFETVVESDAEKSHKLTLTGKLTMATMLSPSRRKKRQGKLIFDNLVDW